MNQRDVPGASWTADRVATGLALLSWSFRVLPELTRASARSWIDPRQARARLRGRARTVGVLAEALSDLQMEPFPTRAGSALRSTTRTMRHAMTASRLRIGRDIRYGPLPGQNLEIWRGPNTDVGSAGAPVLVFVPGGGWIHGRTAGQGHALLGRLAARGWVCVGVNYRVAPSHPWPAHIEDVKRAIAWTRDHIGEYGGSSDFIAIAGASAGGHLAALAGLTADSGRWQAGFETADTHVDAVVSLYGRYDWESRETQERKRFMSFLERIVVGAGQEVAGDVFAEASPMAQLRADSPPFFVIHGSHDAIIPVAQAQEFVGRMQDISTESVLYAELPGAGHGFDVLDPWRATVMAVAVERFLDRIRHRCPPTTGP